MRYGAKRFAGVFLGALAATILPGAFLIATDARAPKFALASLIFVATLGLALQLIRKAQAPALTCAAIVTLVVELTLGLFASFDAAQEIRESAEFRVEAARAEDAAAAPVEKSGMEFSPIREIYFSPASRVSSLVGMLVSIVILYFVLKDLLHTPNVSREEDSLRWLLVAHNPVLVFASYSSPYLLLAWPV